MRPLFPSPQPIPVNRNVKSKDASPLDKGRDGFLYAAFESAGGNNIFRRSPLDLAVAASNVGGDMFQQVYNAGSAHVTYFARFDPATGAQVLGNHAVNRVWNGTVWYSNTIRVERGDSRADEGGCAMLGDTSAWGLPMWPHGGYIPKAGETVEERLRIVDVPSPLDGRPLAHGMLPQRPPVDAERTGGHYEVHLHRSRSRQEPLSNFTNGVTVWITPYRRLTA
jgi:hypothetical protein